jgi:hypothetical protein
MSILKDAIFLLFIVLAWLAGAFLVYYVGVAMFHFVPAEPVIFVYSHVFWLSPLCFAGVLFWRAHRDLGRLNESDRQSMTMKVMVRHAGRFILVTGVFFLSFCLWAVIWPTPDQKSSAADGPRVGAVGISCQDLMTGRPREG